MSTKSNSSRLREEYISLPNGGALYGVMLEAIGERKRVVMVPPLIGASAEMQPMLTFRNLTRQGADVFSFEYRGHERSAGFFSLANSIEDTKQALVWAQSYAERNKVPLHTVSTCYGTITLLANLPNLNFGISSVIAISGLFGTGYVLPPQELASIIMEGVGITANDAGDLVRKIHSREINIADERVLNLFRGRLQKLFPEFDIGNDHFAKLSYDRVDTEGTVTQFLTNNLLDGILVPSDMPCHFFYGTQDKVIGLADPETLARYLKDAQRAAHHAEIHPVEGADHFMSGEAHRKVIRTICEIIECIERDNTKR
ncbi:alpha/beta hydrolase [Candidatus Woesearchaeota archaeon]|nr:alpha/beta hydrolase [Candidatus Woesearchaeota archaeon]